MARRDTACAPLAIVSTQGALVLADGYWLPSNRADPRAFALYKRHYSAERNAPYRRIGNTNFVGSGEPMVLITEACDAIWVWLRNTVERYDKQDGINCSVFRNESTVRSSDLVREADALAWAKWGEQRLFTYVDPIKTARRRSKHHQPGHCFIEAGWRDTGQRSQSGLVLLEHLP